MIFTVFQLPRAIQTPSLLQTHCDDCHSFMMCFPFFFFRFSFFFFSFEVVSSEFEMKNYVTITTFIFPTSLSPSSSAQRWKISKLSRFHWVRKWTFFFDGFVRSAIPREWSLFFHRHYLCCRAFLSIEFFHPRSTRRKIPSWAKGELNPWKDLSTHTLDCRRELVLSSFSLIN